jgi:hypothetical protein
MSPLNKNWCVKQKKGTMDDVNLFSQDFIVTLISLAFAFIRCRNMPNLINIVD